MQSLSEDRTQPLISVCIPVYNGAGYISEAIHSVLAQNYPNLEIIVQDNFSTDDTWSIVEQIAEKNPQLSIQKNARNIGMAPNWNIAVNRAQGEFVMLLSADDILAPNYLSRCLNILKNEAVDVVTTNHYYLKNKKKRSRKVFIRNGEYTKFYNEVLLFNPFPIVFALFRKQTISKMRQRNNLFNERFPLTCDYELLIRLSLKGTSLYYIQEPLASYRIHESNLSRQVPRMNRQAAQVLLYHCAELRQACGLAYRFTLVRFIMRIIRNLIWFRYFDKRMFFVLWKEFWYDRSCFKKGI